jgi:hypothetical protein
MVRRTETLLVLLCACTPSSGHAPPDATSTVWISTATTSPTSPPTTPPPAGAAVATSATPRDGQLQVVVHGGGRHSGREAFAVSAEPSDKAIRVRLDGFAYYCGMAPQFAASLAGSEVIIDTVPLPPEMALPQCFEPAPWVLHVGPLAPGRYDVRVKGRNHPPVSVSVGP